LPIEELFNSLRSQISAPVMKMDLPWLDGLGLSWSRRDMNKDANISRRMLAFTHYVNQFDDINTIIEIMLTEARSATQSEGGAFYLAEGNDRLRLSYVQNDGCFAQGLSNARYIDDTVPIDSSTVLGSAAANREIINIPDVGALPYGLSYSSGGLIDAVAEGPVRSMLTVPVLDYRGGLLAVFQMINGRDVFGNPRPFEETDGRYAGLLARNTMPYLARAVMTRRLIDSMLRMSYLRDPIETAPHVQRVGAFAAEIYHRWALNKKIGPGESRVEEDALRLGAMLHDIGKIGVPDAVLQKPARLTDEEHDIIKTHCAKGASMYSVAHSRLEHIAYEITLHHHQRWDGRGYTGDPDVPVLAGRDIPLFARVTAVADVLDALLFPRVYKTSWAFETAMAELVKNSGVQFDPEIVKAAIEISDTLKAIAERYSS
jgi:HD-GYP domain-containing protein (c-di-GMP phosphodiesterase class II)